jgi:hypothetical protein
MLVEPFGNTEFRLTGTCPRPPLDAGMTFLDMCRLFAVTSAWPEKTNILIKFM